jgi:hypothetical protein
MFLIEITNFALLITERRRLACTSNQSVGSNRAKALEPLRYECIAPITEKWNLLMLMGTQQCKANRTA